MNAVAAFFVRVDIKNRLRLNVPDEVLPLTDSKFDFVKLIKIFHL